MNILDEPKKNHVHIRQVKEIQEQINGALFVVESKDKNKDFEVLSSTIKTIAETVRATFNNREMALCITKLQEAAHWCEYKNVDKVTDRLIEARSWSGEYLEILK